MRHSLVIWFVAGLLAQPVVMWGQAGEGYSVRWVEQFPPEGGDIRRSFGERLSTLLMGPQPVALIKPFSVVGGPAGECWILDQGAGTLIHVEQGKGKLVRSLHRLSPDFPSLVGLCMEPGGDLFCSDSKLNQVFRVGAESSVLFSGSLSLRQPTGMAFHPVTGELWVAETAAHCITILNRQGALVKRIGERGTGPGQFNFPTFLWIDREGRVYIVDSMNFRIQILDEFGNYLSGFGKHGDGSGDLARPKGVATDSHGNIYVTDALFHVVQIFSPKGAFLYSFGGQGLEKGEFWMPAGIYIDETDHIYVADSYNSRIQVFKLEKKD